MLLATGDAELYYMGASGCAVRDHGLEAARAGCWAKQSTADDGGNGDQVGAAALRAETPLAIDKPRKDCLVLCKTGRTKADPGDFGPPDYLYSRYLANYRKRLVNRSAFSSSFKFKLLQSRNCRKQLSIAAINN